VHVPKATENSDDKTLVYPARPFTGTAPERETFGLSFEKMPSPAPPPEYRRPWKHLTEREITLGDLTP